MNDRPLSELRPGDRATVARLDGSGPVRRRLLELGLTPGTEVTLVRLAPLRDPMTIQVRGYQLCVRRSEAETVSVRLADVFADREDRTEENAKTRKGSNTLLAATAAAAGEPYPTSENAKGDGRTHHGDTEGRSGTELPKDRRAAADAEGSLAACTVPRAGLRDSMPAWFARFAPALLRVPSCPSWIRPRGRRP